MKILCIVLLSLFMGCNSTKKATDSKTITLDTSMDCPKGITCSFSLMENKSLVIKKDGIGMTYLDYADSDSTNVIKFKYHKASPEGMADGSYTEEVYMEIKKDVKNLSLENEELKQVKLYFQRMCFCERGTVGYFPVTDGKLEYQRNSDQSASVVLTFQNNKVPQKLGRIAGKVSFEKI